MVQIRRAIPVTPNDDWRTNARGLAGNPVNAAGKNGSIPTVRTPFYNQYDARNVERAGPTACYRACRAMAKGSGVSIPENTTNRIQVARGELADGRVITNRADTQRARNYIDSELGKGRPVVAGFSLFDSNYNRDGITDHFIMVTGKGVDRNGTYYTTQDPLGKDAKQASSRRMYVDPKSGNLIGEGLAGHYELSMVVPSAR